MRSSELFLKELQLKIDETFKNSKQPGNRRPRSLHPSSRYRFHHHPFNEIAHAGLFASSPTLYNHTTQCAIFAQ